jgi:hypothetical protein
MSAVSNRPAVSLPSLWNGESREDQAANHASVGMTVPYYVSEDKPDMRGIKPGCTQLRMTANSLPDLFPASRSASRESRGRREVRSHLKSHEGRTEPLSTDIRR